MLPFSQARPFDATVNARIFADPDISGVAVQVDWQTLEPQEGRFDWTDLDALFAHAVASKKWVHLLIFPGFFSPSWALDGAQTEPFPIQYGPGRGEVRPLPLPWDATYLSRWFAFLKAVGERYGRSPVLRLVAADGPTSVSAEFSLPNTPRDVRRWQAAGYTSDRYEHAWATAFREIGADFPDQCISLSQGAALGIDGGGQIDPEEPARTRQAIVDAGIAALGDRFALQMSDVHAGPGPRALPPADEDALVIGYNGRIITGFQMRTSAERESAVMGAAGDPPLALRRSIDLALAPNAAGHRIDYLEIYAADVEAAEMRTVIHTAALALGER